MAVRIFLYTLFIINALVNLWAVHFNHYEYIIVSKPIICSILVIWLTIETQNKLKYSNFIMFGLFFGCLGDVFLMMKDGESYFLYGLLSFLICHIMYINANYFQFQFKLWKVLLSVIPVSVSVVFFKILQPNLEEMLIPVIVYLLIIVLMTISTIFRNTVVGLKSYITMILGGLFFLVSDSVLAYNKFVDMIPNAGLWIMSTYILAQFCITKAALESKALNN